MTEDGIMTYEKASANVIYFDDNEVFMAQSVAGYGGTCEGYSATPTISYPNAMHAISCGVYTKAGFSKPMPASPCPCINATSGHCYVYG